MWPFKRRRERRRAPRDVQARHLAEESPTNWSSTRVRHAGAVPGAVRFILLQVRDEPVVTRPTIAKAIDLIERRNGMVTDVMSSMVLAVFGLPEAR